MGTSGQNAKFRVESDLQVDQFFESAIENKIAMAKIIESILSETLLSKSVV